MWLVQRSTWPRPWPRSSPGRRSWWTVASNLSDEEDASMMQIETHVDSFVRNCWYVAAWEDEISADSVLERTLLGESIVFYRASDGRVVALENRCCHRGAPLHAGRREGDSLRCPYHGMLFNAEGQCTEIPGQDRVPPRACVRSYPVAERDEMIWIWMGEPAKADPDKLIRFE